MYIYIYVYIYMYIYIYMYTHIYLHIYNIVTHFEPIRTMFPSPYYGRHFFCTEKHIHIIHIYTLFLTCPFIWNLFVYLLGSCTAGSIRCMVMFVFPTFETPILTLKHRSNAILQVKSTNFASQLPTFLLLISALKPHMFFFFPIHISI